MARSRYYYSDMISNFLVKAKDTIIGELSVASQHDINDETNKYLAEKLGRDQATISKWVTKSAQPPLETLIQIAQCLDVDVKDLIRVPEHNPFKD